jgi:prophage regulatory protein
MVQQPMRILRRPQVEQRIGLCRTAIYERLDPNSSYYDQEFPRPIKLGNGKNPPVGWIEAEIDDWLSLQVQRSRAA